jgi:hypothetical protein
MLIKSADDKSKRLALLEDLQKSAALDARQKRWLREELMRCRKGIEGEKESAFYLDSYYKDSESSVLHDLRLVVDGEVAQIDHLVLSRAGIVCLLETKNFAGNLVVNEYGEFTAVYDDERFGIPSPLEQSKRHERVLVRLMDTLGIVGRTDRQLQFLHAVMLHPKAIITRPDPKKFDTSFLIKADQFPAWREKHAEAMGAGSVFKAMLNMRSAETIQEWGEKLKRQHRKADLLALPDFMKPKAVAEPRSLATQPVEARTTSPPAPSAPPVQAPAPAPAPATASASQGAAPAATSPEAVGKKLICAHCGVKISYAEGKFCWNNAKRFGGLQYCREHQGLFQ